MTTQVERLDSMHLARLVGRLSVPFESDDTVAAAYEFLGLNDPSSALDRAYNFLVWQRTLKQVLAHLAGTGFDLNELSISGNTFSATFPRPFAPVWPLDLGPRPTGRQLWELLERHRALLGVPLSLLTVSGKQRFVAVSGRAYQATYPEYSHRAEFDTDLVAPDLESALAIAAILQTGGSNLESVNVRSLGQNPDAKLEMRHEVSHHTVSVGILVGGYHSYRNSLVSDSRVVEWDGHILHVPQPADLLLMLAARVIRKKKFALVNFNDAAVVLFHDSDAIDWEELCQQAFRFRLEPALAVLLAKGEQLVGGSVVPTFVRNQLQGGPWRSSLAWLSHRVADPFSELASKRTPARRRRLITRMWVTAFRLRQHRSQEGERLRGVLLSNFGRRIFHWQLKRIRSGRMATWMSQIGRLLRPRCGAFCEVCPHLAAAGPCLSQLAAKLPNSWDLDSLRSVGALLPLRPGPHNCNELTFDLAVRRSG